MNKLEYKKFLDKVAGKNVQKRRTKSKEFSDSDIQIGEELKRVPKHKKSSVRISDKRSNKPVLKKREKAAFARYCAKSVELKKEIAILEKKQSAVKLQILEELKSKGLNINGKLIMFSDPFIAQTLVRESANEWDMEAAQKHFPSHVVKVVNSSKLDLVALEREIDHAPPSENKEEVKKALGLLRSFVAKSHNKAKIIQEDISENLSDELMELINSGKIDKKISEEILPSSARELILGSLRVDSVVDHAYGRCPHCSTKLTKKQSTEKNHVCTTCHGKVK